MTELNNQQRISVTCLTAKDHENVKMLAREWGCSEPRIISIALHDWLGQIDPNVFKNDPHEIY